MSSYESLQRTLAKRDVFLLGVQYPGRAVEPLTKLVKVGPQVSIVDNQEIFLFTDAAHPTLILGKMESGEKVLVLYLDPETGELWLGTTRAIAHPVAGTSVNGAEAPGQDDGLSLDDTFFIGTLGGDGGAALALYALPVEIQDDAPFLSLAEAGEESTDTVDESDLPAGDGQAVDFPMASIYLTGTFGSDGPLDDLLSAGLGIALDGTAAELLRTSDTNEAVDTAYFVPQLGRNQATKTHDR